MKRTIGLEITAGPLQGNVGRNNFYDVIKRLDLIDDLIVAHSYCYLRETNGLVVR